MPIYLPRITLTLSRGDVQTSAEYIHFRENPSEKTVTRSGQSWFRPIYRQPGEVSISYTSSLYISSWRAGASQTHTIPGEFQISGYISYLYAGCASYTSSGIHILPIDLSQIPHTSTTEHAHPAIPDINGAILQSRANITLTTHNQYTRQGGVRIYVTQGEISKTHIGSTTTSLSLSSAYSKTVSLCGYPTLPDGTTILTRGFKTISRAPTPISKRIQKPEIAVVIAASVHDITKQRGSASISSHGFQLVSGGAEIRSSNATTIVRDSPGVAIKDTIFVHAQLSKYETHVHVVLQVM